MSISPGDILLDPQKRALLRVHLVTASPSNLQDARAFDGIREPEDGVALPEDVNLVGLEPGYTEMTVRMVIPLEDLTVSAAFGVLVRYTGGDFPEIVGYVPFPAPVPVDPEDAQWDVAFTLGGNG